MYLAYQVSRYRPAALPVDADYDAALRFYRHELIRQRDFHRGRAFWLRVLVLLPGPLLLDIGFVLAHPYRLRTIAAHAIAFISLAVLAVPLNVRAARRYDRRIKQMTFDINEP